MQQPLGLGGAAAMEEMVVVAQPPWERGVRLGLGGGSGAATVRVLKGLGGAARAPPYGVPHPFGSCGPHTICGPTSRHF